MKRKRVRQVGKAVALLRGTHRDKELMLRLKDKPPKSKATIKLLKGRNRRIGAQPR